MLILILGKRLRKKERKKGRKKARKKERRTILSDETYFLLIALLVGKIQIKHGSLKCNGSSTFELLINFSL